MTIQHLLNNFYDQHGYGEEGGIHKKWDMIKFGPIALPLPNLESRRKNIYLHDISHLVTGFGTTWQGESSVSSWEIASGGWKHLYFPWFLTLWAMAVGVMFYPTSTHKAFQVGLRMNNALTGGLSKSYMYAISLDQLRQQLERKMVARRSYFWWATLSLIVWWSPILLGLLIYQSL